MLCDINKHHCQHGVPRVKDKQKSMEKGLSELKENILTTITDTTYRVQQVSFQVHVYYSISKKKKKKQQQQRKRKEHRNLQHMSYYEFELMYYCQK